MGMYRDTALGLCIDVSGPDGNVFAIWGLARDLAKQLDKDPATVAKQLSPASLEYEDVLDAFERIFPMVTLVNRKSDDMEEDDDDCFDDCAADCLGVYGEEAAN